MKEDEQCFKSRVRNINNLCYADDATLVSEEAKNQQVLIRKVKVHGKKKRD